MSPASFKIITTGKILPGHDKERVLDALGKLLKAPKEKVEPLLAGQPKLLKSGLSDERAKQHLSALRKIGVDCQTAAQTDAKKANSAASGVTVESIRNAFQGKWRTSTSLAFRAALLVSMTIVVLLPVVYLLLIVGIGYATYWHAVNDYSWIRLPPHQIMLFLYVSLILAGPIIILMLLRPILYVPKSRHAGQVLDVEKHPKLKELLQQLSQQTGAPFPTQVRINAEVNAAAAPASGLGSIFSRKLVLYIGLPLFTGMRVNQLAGVIAHEFGHFSQFFTMSSYFIIHSINRWYLDAIHRRGRLDEWIEESIEKYNDVRSWPFGFAKLGLWFGRKVLGLFLELSIRVSMHLSRQMEYDADRYECAIAGSKTFESTSRRLSELSIGYKKVGDEGSHLVQDGKWLEDFQPLLKHFADSLDSNERKWVDSVAESRENSKYDTHPDNGFRIAAAEELDLEPIFNLDFPAHQLIENYEAVCKAYNVFWFKQVLGPQFSTKQLVSVQATKQLASKRIVDDQALKDYLASLFCDFRFIVPENSGAAVEEAAAKSQLTQLVSALRRELPIFTNTTKSIESLARRLADANAAKMLTRAGIQYSPQYFSLAQTDEHSIDSAIAVIVEEQKALVGSLEKIESLVAKRIGLALVILRQNGSIEMYQQISPFVAVLGVLKKSVQSQSAFAISSWSIATLVHNVANGETVATDLQNASVTRCIDDYKQLLATLSKARYPFNRGDKDMSVAEYVMDMAGTPDNLFKNPQEIADSHNRVQNCLGYLNARMMSELATAALAVERRLGVEPIKLFNLPSVQPT